MIIILEMSVRTCVRLSTFMCLYIYLCINTSMYWVDEIKPRFMAVIYKVNLGSNSVHNSVEYNNCITANE